MCVYVYHSLGYFFAILRIQILFFVDNNSTFLISLIHSHLIKTENTKNGDTILR